MQVSEFHHYVLIQNPEHDIIRQAFMSSGFGNQVMHEQVEDVQQTQDDPNQQAPPPLPQAAASSVPEQAQAVEQQTEDQVDASAQSQPRKFCISALKHLCSRHMLHNVLEPS